MTSIIRIATIVLFMVSQHAMAQALTKMQEVVETARSRGNGFSKIPLFSRLSDPEVAMQQTLTRGGLLALDRAGLQQLRKAKPESITLDLPFTASRTITVELVKNEIFSSDFKVTSSAPSAEATGYQRGVYYQGIVRNTQGRSLAAISIVGDEVIGVIDVEGEGNFILGELEGDERGRYAFFRADDLKHDMKTACDTENVPQTVLETAEQIELNAEDPNKCVRIYFECEYDMFVSRNSSVQNTVDYMTGIYNVVKTLYDNEQVNTVISEIFVWTTPDTYPTSSTRDALYAFRTARGTSFNGDLAHLVSRGAPTGGGIAFLNVTCNKGSAFAYSYIHGSYSQFPAYSWTVMVIAHEMGHNLGSPHTHACSWDVNGDGVAGEMIDGCGPNRGYSEGSCPVAPLPTNGGTVMSYCHLVSGVGINLNNGFGPLPAARIRNRVYNGTCLTACGSCQTTVSITKTDVNCFGGNNGSITATGGGSTGSYTYTWAHGPTTATISNLTAGTYTVTVRGQNGAGCPTSASVTITQPAALNPTAVVTPESVPGAGNGNIDVSVAGGTAPYTYVWNNGATSQDLTNIAGGSYTVTVTDSKGCTAQRTYVVGSNGCGVQLTTFPVFEGFETGLGIFAQSTADNYDWTRQSGTTPNNRTGPSGAYQGSWYLYAQGKGNTGDAIIESPCIDLIGKSNTELQFAYSMNGSQIGTLWAEVSTNNGLSWTVLWNRTGNQGTNWLIAGVSLENYKTAFTKIRFRATAGGNFGDIAIDAINITASTPPCNAPILSTSATGVSCAGGTNGSASVLTTGGTQPYGYAWSNGGNAATIQGIPAGTYSVTVTDALGCASTAQAVVTQPAPLTASATATPVSATGATDGTVTLTVGGGTSPYGYAWSNGASTPNLAQVGEETYSVVVTDANGCKANASATVGVNEPVTCQPVSALPYTESFEAGLGLWTQATNDIFDWRRNSGGTPTANTGPSGAANGTFYMYTEANDASSGSTAILESPCFNLSGISNAQVSFAWHMLGNQMGSLTLQVTSDNGNNWTTVWSRSGSNGNTWVNQSVPLGIYQNEVIKLRFVGTLSNGVRGDMAIDNVAVTGGAAVSEAITTAGESGFEWKGVYPNPSTGRVNLEIYSAQATVIQLSVADVLGRITDLGKQALSAGNNVIGLNLPAGQSGLFLLKMIEGGRVQSKPVMIMR